MNLPTITSMEDLKTAFLETDYVITDPKFSLAPFTVNIDNFHRPLDQAITPSKNWCIITAWNPLPETLSLKENKSRNFKLLFAVQDLDYQGYKTVGVAKDKSRQEDSFFIPGISRLEATMLAKEFGQKAIVYGVSNKPAELILFK